MRIPPEKLHIIAQSLERFLEESAGTDLGEVAKQHRAIPLYGSWTGTVFLRTDGAFFTLDQEDHPCEFLPEQDERWQIAALATAARRNAALQPLLPLRPAEGSDCGACSGRGIVVFGESQLDVTCGACSGLGWLLRADAPLTSQETGG